MKSCTASFGLGRIIPFPSGSLALFHSASLRNSSSTAPCPIGGKATPAGNFACATAGYGGGGGGIGTDTSVAPLGPSRDAADVVPEGTTVADATDTAPAASVAPLGPSCDAADVVPEGTTVADATGTAPAGTIFSSGTYPAVLSRPQEYATLQTWFPKKPQSPPLPIRQLKEPFSAAAYPAVISKPQESAASRTWFPKQPQPLTLQRLNKAAP